ISPPGPRRSPRGPPPRTAPVEPLTAAPSSRRVPSCPGTVTAVRSPIRCAPGNGPAKPAAFTGPRRPAGGLMGRTVRRRGAGGLGGGRPDGDAAGRQGRTRPSGGVDLVRDPELVSCAQRAASELERAWSEWRHARGLAEEVSESVASYVAHSIDHPWGRPRVVLGLD